MKVILPLGKAVSFDCFVHLRTNKRIVQFLKKGDVFTRAKDSRLLRHKYQTIYIRKRDIPLLNKHLKSLQGETPEGATEFGKVKWEQETIEPWESGHKGDIKVKDVPSDEDKGLVTFLEERIDDFAGEIRFSSEVENSEIAQVIASATSIEDTIEYAKISNSASDAEIKETIEGITQKIEEPIQAVKELAEECDDPRSVVLGHNVKGLIEQATQLKKLSDRKRISKRNWLEFKSKVRQRTQSMRNLYKIDKQILDDSLNHLITELDEIIGEDLHFKPVTLHTLAKHKQTFEQLLRHALTIKKRIKQTPRVPAAFRIDYDNFYTALISLYQKCLKHPYLPQRGNVELAENQIVIDRADHREQKKLRRIIQEQNEVIKDLSELVIRHKLDRKKGRRKKAA